MKLLTQKMIDKIDWRTLETEISRRIGVYVELEVKLTARNRIELQSTTDLVKQAGIFSSSLKSLRVINFGSHLDKSGKFIWLPIHFSYEFHSGGSNGHGIFWAQYHFVSKNWNFRKRDD